MDSSLRDLERRCEANPGDQETLAALIEARYRANLPVTAELLERRVFPARSFDSTSPLTVLATPPGGREVAVGWTPGPVQIPVHSSWRVELRPRNQWHFSELVSDLTGRGVTGVRVFCELLPPAALRVRSLPLTSGIARSSQESRLMAPAGLHRNYTGESMNGPIACDAPARALASFSFVTPASAPG